MITKFIVGVAAIALSTTPLHADPGGGHSKGGGGGGPEQSHGGPKGGGGNGKARDGDRGGHKQQAQAPRQEQASRRDNGNGNVKAKGRDVDSHGNPGKEVRGPDRDRDAGRDRGRPDRADQGPQSAGGDFRRSQGRDDARPGGDDFRGSRPADRDAGNRNPGRAPFRWASLNRRDMVKGCPPGLAKKNNGCTPPGLANQQPGPRYDDWRSSYDRPDWWGYDGYQGRYSYYDGRLLQLGGNGSILGYLPLLGGSLSPGQLWPSYYEPVEVPDYYESYYNLGSDDNYRYYDDAFYSVDPQTQAISAITALLTGDEFAVGQRLPEGYDVYNVPYSYRDEYADGPDAEYRYSDGYIYEVDPTTQLIQTAIELLT